MAFFTAASFKISFKVHKEPIFPCPSFDRVLFDLCHIQIIVNKMREDVIQRPALMWYLKADTDLSRLFQIYLLIRDNDKASRIITVIIDSLFQNLQMMDLCCISLHTAACVFFCSFSTFCAAIAVFATLICFQLPMLI